MDKNRMCSIVEDLLPSYFEGLTNDTTNEMIKEHIKVCDKCKEHKEKILVSNKQLLNNEKEKSNRFKKMLSRYRYQLVGLLLGVILTVVAILGSFAFIIAGLNKDSYTESHTADVEKYREFDEYYGISKLYLFPNASLKKNEEAKIHKYLYNCKGSKVFQTCQIFLECEYSWEAYEKEKKRLTEVADSETKLQAKYTENDFPYPAVYAMKGNESCYEYVLLLEEEKKMIYIYLQGSIDRRELLFSKEYLPLSYGQNGLNFEEIGYNIYSVANPIAKEE